MEKIINVFWKICLFKLAPQDLPASNHLMLLSMVLYGIVSALIGLLNLTPGAAFLSAIFDIALVGAMTQLLLWIKHLTPRFQQAFTALMGSGAILGLFALPWLFLNMQMAEAPALLPSLIILGLVMWNLGIVGHILRHTISAPFYVGVLLAILFMYVSMSTMRSLFGTTN